jgi:adenylate cyclase
MVIVILVQYYQGELIQTQLGVSFPLAKFLVIDGLYLLLGIVTLRDLRLRAATNEDELEPLSERWHYISSCIEIGLPSAILWCLFQTLPPETVVTSSVGSIYYLLIFLSVLKLDMRVSIFVGLLSAGAYLIFISIYIIGADLTDGIKFLSNPIRHCIQAFTYVLTGVLVGWISKLIYLQMIGVLYAERESIRIKNIFGQHVSPQVVQSLLKQDLGEVGQTREVSVLFLDIRDFTTFCETRSPGEVVEHLNKVFGALIVEINRHQGVINKFLGDGFMAVFGAPLDDPKSSQNALRAAVSMLRVLEDEVHSGRIEATRIGIGIHSGYAMTGTIGSEERREYTVIGDTVNLAARIESLNKQYQAQILISDEVYAQVQSMPERDRLVMTGLGPLQVKGRIQPVSIYRVDLGVD